MLGRRVGRRAEPLLRPPCGRRGGLDGYVRAHHEPDRCTRLPAAGPTLRVLAWGVTTGRHRDGLAQVTRCRTVPETKKRWDAQSGVRYPQAHCLPLPPPPRPAVSVADRDHANAPPFFLYEMYILPPGILDGRANTSRDEFSDLDGHSIGRWRANARRRHDRS